MWNSRELFNQLWDWYALAFAFILMVSVLVSLCKWTWKKFREDDNE